MSAAAIARRLPVTLTDAEFDQLCKLLAAHSGMLWAHARRTSNPGTKADCETAGNRARDLEAALVRRRWTTEAQPDLPEAGQVRDLNNATPTLEAPFSLSAVADTTTRGRQSDLF